MSGQEYRIINKKYKFDLYLKLFYYYYYKTDDIESKSLMFYFYGDFEDSVTDEIENDDDDVSNIEESVSN